MVQARYFGGVGAAAAAALWIAGAAGAQVGDAEDAGTQDQATCGGTFASSGAASNVAYASAQLRACDAAVQAAKSAAELNEVSATIIRAHAELLARWQVVAEELIETAARPAVAPPADGAEAPADPWRAKLAERQAIETGMDGLRILMRLSFQLSQTYADPASLAAALEGDAASQVNVVLSSRRVCASGGNAPRGNTPATAPSWYAFADIIPTGDDPPVQYEREIIDDVAAMANAYVMDVLETAPSLNVTGFSSFHAKADCPLREFPSERSES
jgi:hypothetical protein